MGAPGGGAAAYYTYKALTFSMNHGTLSTRRIRNKPIKKSFRFVMPEREREERRPVTELNEGGRD